MLRSILLKRGIRNDKLWAYSFFSRTPLKEMIVLLDTYALLKSQYWPSRKMEEIKFKRIKEILQHAAAKISFWQEKFKGAGISPESVQNWSDYLRIPITKKTEFKNKPITYFVDNELFAKGYITDRTSGSTAEPFVFFQDHYYELRSLAVCRRIILTASGGKLLPVIQVRSRYRRGFANTKAHWFFAYSYNQLKYRIENLFRLTKTLRKPFILYGFSSYIIEIARLCSARRLPIYPAAIIATGEGLRTDQKEYIESILRAKVFNCYTTTELGWLAQDCEKHNLHINEEFAHLEILGKDGAPLPNGREGRVVITTFDNKIMPFIRYDTGDLGTIIPEQCTCGRKLPQLKILGRQTDLIRLANHRAVPFLDVLGVFESRHNLIRQYQLIQRELNEFTVKVIPEKTLESDQLVEMANHLRRNLHPEIKIEFEVVDEIESAPSGKMVYFKSLLNKVGVPNDSAAQI